MRVFTLTCLAVFGLALMNLARADHHEGAEGAEEPKPAQEKTIPDEFKDEAFKDIDLGELADAWRDADHDVLIEIGTKLADAERGRGGVRAKPLFVLAARKAAAVGDVERLKELLEIAKKRGWTRLATMIERLIQAAGATRSEPPAVNINANEVSGGTLSTYEQLIDRIEAAGLAGDTTSLDGIAKILEESAEDWPVSMLAALKNAIAEARASAGEAIEGGDMLDKLIGESRVIRIWRFRNTSTTRRRTLKTIPTGLDNTAIGPETIQTVGKRRRVLIAQDADWLYAHAYGPGNQASQSRPMCPAGDYRIKRRGGKIRIDVD